MSYNQTPRNSRQLRIDQLTKRFPVPTGEELTVLDSISIVVEPGETLAVVGPSGAGKSTLLNLIGALEPPTSGTIAYGSQEVTALKGDELAAFRATAVGFVFQDHHLLPQLTAAENLLLPTLALAKPAGAGARAVEEDAEGRADWLLQRVGLTERQEAFPAQLSGGERQRVALARALINQPGLLLCDEPTGNLDHDTGERVVSLLLELAGQQGVTVIMVTHNTEQAKRCGRVLQLRGGKLAPAGGEQ